MERVTSRSDAASVAGEQAARRTGMAFQRTRLSADRTLMSVIRTSLSLISFGFTIAQVFRKLKESDTIKGSELPPEHFGAALVLLGIAMLVMGIAYHGRFMFELRAVRRKMAEDGLIRGETGFPASLTLITALLLLMIGIAAAVSIISHAGPFG
jgi:inner membrane protein YidH